LLLQQQQDDRTHISRLYPEILAIIFGMLEVRDRGRAAQVCQTWKEAAYHRSVWRSCEPKLHLRRANPSLFPSLVRRGIRRVQILSLRRSLRDVTQGLPNIESLDLSGCFNVTDIGIAHALTADVPTLKRLNLSLCKQITDSSLSKLAQYCRQLQELDLGGCCNVTNAGLLLIAWGLKSLKSLNLRSCWHVSDLGIASLAGLGSDAEGNLALEHLGLQVPVFCLFSQVFSFLFGVCVVLLEREREKRGRGEGRKQPKLVGPCF
jgi:F-box/leucine-rich repeat protein 14